MALQIKAHRSIYKSCGSRRKLLQQLSVSGAGGIRKGDVICREWLRLAVHTEVYWPRAGRLEGTHILWQTLGNTAP